jgi:DNA-binding CsgD family transcriptional regulator
LLRPNALIIKAIFLSVFLTGFLCLRGFSQVSPDNQSKLEPSSPRIVITKVKLLGRYSRVRSDAEVKKVFEYPESVRITWKDNFLIVEFEMLNGSDPQKNEYAYKIFGHDENWIHIGNKNNVILENLKPGSYDLGVKGANSEGIWDHEGKVLTIHVIPAWWKTSLVTIILLIAGSSVLLIVYRQWRKLSRSRLRDEIDIGRMASEFNLTNRETEILELLLKGKSIKEISQDIYISESTVQKHIYSVYKKLKIKNRMQLLNIAQRFRAE